MGTPLTWKEPREVTEHHRFQGLPALNQFVRLFAKWSLLLGVPALLAVAWWAPTLLLSTLWTLAAALFVTPILLALQVWAGGGYQSICTLRSSGVVIVTGGGGHRYSWQDVEAHVIDDHPELADVRRITLTIHRRGRRLKTTVCFSPKEVDEVALNALLDEYSQGGAGRGRAGQGGR